MDDVKVHYNSDKPAQLQAHAYAQGTGIHIAPGQERHLPHEAWHVVQQKQGRIKPTHQMKGGVNMNDDKGLEKEADVMGEQALQFKSDSPSRLIFNNQSPYSNTAQLNNKVSKTVQYGLGGLLAGAGLFMMIKNRPEVAGRALAQLATVMLPTIISGIKGFMVGKAMDDDEAEWESLKPILEIFPNKQPQNLENEIGAYQQQLDFDEGMSFIVSYRDKKAFEKALNSGQGFIWVYTQAKDLRIGSKEKNQHSVVGGGVGVYSAGEGVKPAVAGKVADLKNSISLLELKAEKVPDARSTYLGMVEDMRKELTQALLNTDRELKIANDIVHLNLRSGHYAPTIDMDRWSISVYAWKQAGYKALMIPGGNFLPNQEAESKKNK